MTRPPTPGVSDGHYVYILRCADDSYYTGYTTDPARRVAEHNAGDGAKYTRGRTPVECVYLERHDSKSDAMSREYEIKQHTRVEKDALVADADPSLPNSDDGAPR
ncbi:MAG: putative endonuclease containing a URI domain protein [uncultured archaeon A07HN63]|nr:MAG: putative endonuclease containing a URI domain protein [uncultured archaeon A07HN63]